MYATKKFEYFYIVTISEKAVMEKLVDSNRLGRLFISNEVAVQIRVTAKLE